MKVMITQMQGVKTFENKFHLSKDTISSIEKSTKLSYEELTNLSLKDSKELMKERGSLKESGKIKQWLSDIYLKLGEKLGFIEKNYNIYTDIH